MFRFSWPATSRSLILSLRGSLSSPVEASGHVDGVEQVSLVFHEAEQRLAALGIPDLIVECEAVDLGNDRGAS
jgi:hypothetical protein